MAEPIQIIKVFIGSPGGLVAERQAAARIAQEINQSHSENWGCQLHLVGWEATIPGNYRAQSLINQDLDKCDYFVGILWNHWGSKPDDGDSKYTSGFEEEFERAKSRFSSGLIRDIALFFKDIPDEQQKDPGPSVSKVIEFRQKCVQLRKPLFKTFKETTDFDPMFRLAMERIGWAEYNRLGKLADRRNTVNEPETADKERLETTVEVSTNLLEPPAIEFVSQLLKRRADWAATDAYEIARFRLISAGTNRSGNDEVFLGPHDANLLFRVRERVVFSDQEIYTLIDTGVAGFHHQNVPLWHWIAKEPGDKISFNRVHILSIAGSLQVPAIRVLQSAGQDTPILNYTREDTLRMWLLGERENTEIAATLDFIRTNGGDRDRVVLEKILPEVDIKHKSAVAATIIYLQAKHSALSGLTRLIEDNIDDISDELTSVIFKNSDYIPTTKLKQCLVLRSPKLRRNGAEELNKRDAMTAEEALQLFSDSDPAVRLASVECLTRRGKILTDDELKSALILPASNGLFGLSIGAYKSGDDTYYRAYFDRQLATKNYSELSNIVTSSNVFAYQELSALYNRFTRRCSEEIKQNLADGFRGYFDRKLGSLSVADGSNAKLISEIKDLGEFLRLRLTSIALDALCAWAGESALEIVRKTIDGYEVHFSENVLKYLSRFGDWSDTDRIIAFYHRVRGGLSFMTEVPQEKRTLVASALHAVWKGRLVDLLDQPIDSALRPLVLRSFTKSEIEKLSDESLIRELNNDYEETRKVIALRISEVCSTKRVRLIINKYTEAGNKYYYNAAHWLDLGASMPRSYVRKVTHFELSKMNR